MMDLIELLKQMLRSYGFFCWTIGGQHLIVSRLDNTYLGDMLLEGSQLRVSTSSRGTSTRITFYDILDPKFDPQDLIDKIIKLGIQ